MNFRELLKFNGIHIEAVGFVIAATDDYVACRCCLLNGLFPGLRLGAEAVEKFLKAFLKSKDPYSKIKYGHNIKSLARDASKLPGRFSTAQFDPLIARLETYYRFRYPDEPDFKPDASTAELADIDELVLHIYEGLPIPDVPKFHNYGLFSFICRPLVPPIDPYLRWLVHNNLAVQRVKAVLLQRYKAVEKQL